MLIVNEKISVSGQSRVVTSAIWNVPEESIQNITSSHKYVTEGMNAALLGVVQAHPFAQSKHSICLIERFHDGSSLCTVFSTDGTRFIEGVRILGGIIACSATIEIPLIAKYFSRRYGDNAIVQAVELWQSDNK